MRALSLAALTLLFQGAAGSFWAILAVRFWAASKVGWPRAEAWAFPVLITALASALLAILLAFVHVAGSAAPRRPLLNPRRPGIGRVALLGIFFLLAACATAPIKFFPMNIPFLTGTLDGTAALAGILLVLCLASAHGAQRDRLSTPAVFVAASLLLGTLAAGVGLALGPAPPDLRGDVLGYLALAALGFLMAETVLAYAWLSGLTKGSPEARGAGERMLGRWRGALIVRMSLAGACTLACAAAIFSEEAAAVGLAMALLCAVVSEGIGQALLAQARSLARESP